MMMQKTLWNSQRACWKHSFRWRVVLLFTFDLQKKTEYMSFSPFYNHNRSLSSQLDHITIYISTLFINSMGPLIGLVSGFKDQRRNFSFSFTKWYAWSGGDMSETLCKFVCWLIGPRVSKYVRLLKTFVWFVVSQTYIWFDEDRFL